MNWCNKLFLCKDKYLMDLQRRINAFKKIGDYLREDFFLDQHERINEVEVRNPWFTKNNIKPILF